MVEPVGENRTRKASSPPPWTVLHPLSVTGKSGFLVEYGEFRTDQNITLMWDRVWKWEFDDDFYDDFVVWAIDEQTWEAIDLEVTVIAENQTIVAYGSTEDDPFIAANLPMGNYSYTINDS